MESMNYVMNHEVNISPLGLEVLVLVEHGGYAAPFYTRISLADIEGHRREIKVERPGDVE